MLNIVQLGLQLAELSKDGLTTFKHHPAGIGEQQPASIADQQGRV